MAAIFPDITQGSNMTFAAVGLQGSKVQTGIFSLDCHVHTAGYGCPLANLLDNGIENA